MQVIPTTSGFIPNGQGAHAMNSGFLPGGQGAPAFIGTAQPPGMAPGVPAPVPPSGALAALEVEAANLFARMRAAVAAAAAAPAPAPAAPPARGDVDRWLAALEARLTVLERWAFSRVPVPAASPAPPANAHDHGPTPAELDAPPAPTEG